MKVFLFSVLAFFLALVSFGQMTNGDILRMIQMSKEYNQQVVNPNVIFPGQTLTYQFLDGSIVSIEVEPGDSQWTIVRDKLSKLEIKHGPVVEPTPIMPEKTVVIEEVPEKISEKEKDLSWLIWVFLALGLLLFAYLLYSMRFRNIDPVTAGRPQVEGGVNDAGAHDRMREVAENRFPGGSRLDVRNIRRGTLSGRAIVFYQGQEKPKRIHLRKVPAYAGEIMVNGNEQTTIYFLQGCGNDARRGDYFYGKDLTFVPEVLINQDGTESPIPSDSVAQDEVRESVTKVPKEKSDSAAVTSSDEVMISNDHATVADEFLKTQRAHRVTMEYTKSPDGSVVIKSVFETKNEPVKDTEKIKL